MPYYFMSPFFLVFFTAFAFIIFAFVRSAKEAGHNARSPRLTVPARIVAKRTQIGGRAGSTGTHGYMTRYFATFEVESGDRMELTVPENEYGYLIEGDEGTLTFQGNLFLSFTR